MKKQHFVTTHTKELLRTQSHLVLAMMYLNRRVMRAASACTVGTTRYKVATCARAEYRIVIVDFFLCCALECGKRVYSLYIIGV